MARQRVTPGPRVRQLVLPGFEGLVAAEAARPASPRGAATRGDLALDWETRSFQEGCRVARERAQATLGALEAWLHAGRPAGYQVVGWRWRTLVTRMGEVRVGRRLYRAPGTGHPQLLLDAHLGWTPRQVATPSLLALLVTWASEVPFEQVAGRLADVTAGVVRLSGTTVWRRLRQVTERARQAERAIHRAWTTDGTPPQPAGERVVPVLYVEADGVWVKTQREPAHPTGYELKCASAYEGWVPQGPATPGHPRPRYGLAAKRVYCHTFDRAVLPFWEGASLALASTYDLSRLPLVVVGGDGAEWIDTAHTVFPHTVRQRDGFHLARDAARGWGTEVGATLYAAVRQGPAGTVQALLAGPAPPRAALAPAALPPPARVLALPAPGATAPAGAAAPPAPAAPPRRPTWSARQVRRARQQVTSQVGAPDGGADWRQQVPPEAVPPGARALGTQEGTNAHLLARRMKRRGCSWTVAGARRMAKARELVTMDTLARWCVSPARAAPAAAPAAGRPGVVPGHADRLPWPALPCPAAHGPLRDPAVAHLSRLLQGGYLRM